MADGPGGKEVGRLSLKVVPDTTDFGPELKAFAERMEEQVKVELKVHLDTESVVQELALLQARMDAADLTLDIDLDAATALARLDMTLAAMQATAYANPIDVRMDVDAGRAAAQTAVVTTAMQGAASGSSSVGRQIALWGPLIFVAAVAIAAIGPALAAIIPLIAGMAFGIGAVVLGWKSLKKVLDPLIKAFKGMRAEIGKTLTAGLGPLIKTLATSFVPILKDGLVAFAGLFNTAAKGLLEFLNSAEGLELMKSLVESLSAAFAPFAALVAPLAEVFMRLTVAAAPALKMMGDALVSVTTQFATFLEKGSASSVITDSMQDLGHILQSIGSFGADIFPSLFAAAPAVIAFLDGMLESLGAMFKVLKPVFDFMSKHTGTMGLLGAVLGTIAVGLALVTAATAAWNLVLALNPISLIVIAIAGLIAGLIYAYNHFTTFRKIVDAVWEGIKLGLTVAWSAIKKVIEGGVAFVMLHIKAIQAVVGIVRDAFGRAREAVSTAITRVIELVKGMPGKAVGALGDLGRMLYDKGKELIQGFIDGIAQMAKKVKDAAKAVLGGIGKLVPGSPVKEGPLRVFNKGRTGALLMQMLADGITSGGREVQAAMDRVSGDLTTSMDIDPQFNARTAGAVLDAAAASTPTDEWTEIQVTNWETGRAMIRRTARDEVAANAHVQATDERMGVNGP